MRRGLLAVMVFAALVLAGVDGQYVLLPFVGRAPLAARVRAAADREWYPVYPRFLNEVRARTEPGSTIALVVPPQRWMDGYDFAFYRASYFLAGRTVLPLLDSSDAPHPENARAAEYVAVFGRPFRANEQLAIVWRGEGGALLRRR